MASDGLHTCAQTYMQAKQINKFFKNLKIYFYFMCLSVCLPTCLCSLLVLWGLGDNGQSPATGARGNCEPPGEGELNLSHQQKHNNKGF